jgi:hypothetical protein
LVIVLVPLLSFSPATLFAPLLVHSLNKVGLLVERMTVHLFRVSLVGALSALRCTPVRPKVGFASTERDDGPLVGFVGTSVGAFAGAPGPGSLGNRSYHTNLSEPLSVSSLLEQLVVLKIKRLY